MWWTRLKDSILEPKLESLRGLRGWCVRAARVGYFSVHKLRADLGLERAATLSFVTILSLIPAGILFFSFADLVGAITPITEYVKENILPLAAPDFQKELGSALDEYFTEQEQFREGMKGWAGFVGILTLIPAALGMMVTAERTLNLIWKVPTRRTYLQRFATFWVVLTTSPFILLATTWVQDFLVPSGGRIEQITRDSIVLGTIYHFLVPVSIGFVAFTVVYVYMPATSVKLKHAAVGGFVAAALWETSKRCFYLYVERSDSLYGRMAIIPLSLVWLYINWLVVLVGCEVSYVVQNLRGMHRERSRESRQPLTVVGLAYIEALVKAFLTAGPISTPRQFADRWDLDAQQVSEAAERLGQAGVLAETTEEKGGYVPARAPETIGLEEVLDALLDPADACLIRGADEESVATILSEEEEEEGGPLRDVRSLELLRRSGTAYRSVLKDVALTDVVGRPQGERSNGGAT